MKGEGRSGEIGEIGFVEVTGSSPLTLHLLSFFSMRAARLTAVNQLEIAEVPPLQPGAGEAVVAVRAAALNHRDVWIKTGQYAGLKWPCIPGSDGAGIVQAVGPGGDPAWVGREVIINPALGWGTSEAAQGPAFNILGLPRDGTLAEQVAVPVSQLVAKPAHLSWVEAAALPLAGLTAYRALFSRAGLRPGDRVLISGIGGGVALFALQFAVAHGAEVWVTSSAPDKIKRAVGLGATGGFNYTEPDWAKAASAGGLFDVVIDGAGGAGFEALLDLTAPGGRVVFYGATRGNPPGFTLRKVFWRQISVLGTTMGSPADWAAMVAFVARHKLTPIISDQFPLEHLGEAFELMENGAQFGKIVVKVTE